MIRRRAGFALAGVLAAAGCGPPAPPGDAVARFAPDPQASAATARGVTLRAEPISGAERQRQAFGADLSARGIVPLFVTVENGGPLSLDLRGRDLLLEVGGASLRATSPALVGSSIGEGGGVTAAGLAGAALFGLPGMMVASAAAGQGNRQNLQNSAEAFVAIALRDGTLPPGGSARGFAFFTPPPALGAFDAAVLLLRGGAAGTAEGIEVRLPLSGLGHRPR